MKLPGIDTGLLINFNALLGIRHSMHELSYFDQILSIPLYMVSQFQRLVRNWINTQPGQAGIEN